jgi:hypothetical protein
VKLEEQVTNDEDDDDVMQQRTVEQLIDEMIEQRQQLQKSCAELREGSETDEKINVLNDVFLCVCVCVFRTG